MRRIQLDIAKLMGVSFLLLCDAGIVRAGSPPPPAAPVKPVTDKFFGAEISDPYRYMENFNDPEVQRWVKAEDNYTRSVLEDIPGRQALLARIRELGESVPRVGVERLPGDIYLVFKRLPGENTEKLYLRHGLTGTDRLIVDPEKVKLAPESQSKGKNVLANVAASNDNKYVAVDIQPGGSEVDGELHVFEIATGRDVDSIPRVGAEAAQPSWLADNHSFVYGRLQKLAPGAPAAEQRQKFRSYLHVLGTDSAKDQPVFGYGVVPGIEVDPSLIASVEVQPNSRYAIGVLNGSVTPNSAYYVAPAGLIGKPNVPWRKIADLEDGVTSIAVHGDDLYALTYKGAPRSKIVRLDARNPSLASAVAVVPPGESVIQAMQPAGDALYAQLLDGGIGRVLRVPYGSSPKPEAISLPFDGTVYVRGDPRVPGVRLYATSWTRAFQILFYDPATRLATDTKLQPMGPNGSPEDLRSTEVKVKAGDGTPVPLSIVSRKELKLDGSNPTLLEGYGSYGIPLSPGFDATRLAWSEQGGVYAVCHVRGGGEYGEEWHLAGKGATKPNTWKDFIACAEYLIQQGYTSPRRLGGLGISAGGITIGRAITERPDLFAAAIDSVGVSDTLRFEATSNGETNVPEFGSVKTNDGFEALSAMSAYGHIKDRTAYPAVLFMTGTNDPRVDSWQMAKMAARMQAATSSGRPVLLRVDFQGGHGDMGGTASQQEESLADEFAFLLWQFGMPGFQPNLTKP